MKKVLKDLIQDRLNGLDERNERRARRRFNSYSKRNIKNHRRELYIKFQQEAKQNDRLGANQ